VTVLQGRNLAVTFQQGQNLAVTVFQGRNLAVTVLQGRNLAVTVFQGRNLAVTVLQGRNLAVTVLHVTCRERSDDIVHGYGAELDEQPAFGGGIEERVHAPRVCPQVLLLAASGLSTRP